MTGRAGQVVTSLIERGLAAGHDIVALGRPDLDLADPVSVARSIKAAAPDAIVSAAAYTAVDRAETESEIAYSVNARGPGAVARTARALGVPLVHLSTDYVFSGRLDRPYREVDPIGPTGVYGASKLAGDEAVLAAYAENSAILRVAWVYGPFGGNFVKTMMRLAVDRDEVSVVADQIGNPTSSLDIADGILAVLARLVASDDPTLRGIFHMTARGEASWADLAEAAFALLAERNGRGARVKRITSSDYPTQARRPANSRLDSDRIDEVHGVRLSEWRGSLAAVMARLHRGNV